MKRAALAVALVAASTGIASAGGYIGLGIGTAPAIDMDGHDTANEGIRDAQPDGRSGRLLGGFRFGRFAIEGAVGGFDARLPDGNYPYKAYQAQLSGKFTLPLDDHFGAFGRLGLNKLWFNNDAGRTDLDVSGSGVVVGAGFEYRFDAGLAGGSIFVEYQYSRADVSGDVYDFGTTHLRMWTLGATLSF
jgi:hypothetical protein